MSNSLRPCGLYIAHQASQLFTISQSLLRLMSIESVMPSNHLILLCHLLLLPSIFTTMRVFSSELALHQVLLIASHFLWGTTPPLPSVHMNTQPGM